eukprot:m.72512 g.72512  ORF g.72512 m.72512 type:complete len:400 (-) comp14254_c0_seq4:44-1243(-)
MGLEATMICVDNSDWMRNGDLSPTRLDAQADAVNMTANRKLNDNPESTVGLMTIGEKREVLVTLNRDMGKILSMLHRVTLGGPVDLLAGIQVAQLVLKHRQSKNHRQRIILFVGSPIEAKEKELTKLGSKLKKNNVAVDVISFGETEHNEPKLEAFIKAANKDDNSHLLTVHAGTELTDVLISHPILCGEDGPPTQDFPFGVDPSVDPELAMALRLSAEEARDRQRQADGGDAGADAGNASTPTPAPATTGGDGPAPMDVMEDDGDAELRAALALSLQEAQSMSGGDSGATEGTLSDGAPQPMETAADNEADADDEQAQIQRALQMSMAQAGEGESASASKQEDGSEDPAAALQDPSFLQNVLRSLPNVDPDDPEIQGVLSALCKKPEDKKEGDDDKKE